MDNATAVTTEICRNGPCELCDLGGGHCGMVGLCVADPGHDRPCGDFLHRTTGALQWAVSTLAVISIITIMQISIILRERHQ